MTLTTQLAIGGQRARIHPYDARKLAEMARAVAQDRPSFGLIRGELEGEPVSIFTRRLGGRSHAERREVLLVVGALVRLELHAQDADLLPLCRSSRG